MKVLDLDKMKRLESLGVDTSKASFVICSLWSSNGITDNVILENGVFPEEPENDEEGREMHHVGISNPKPVFCLQDIIDALPLYLLDNRTMDYSTYWLEIDKQNVLYVNFNGGWMKKDGEPIGFGISNGDVLENAYLALVYIYENGLNN